MTHAEALELIAELVAQHDWRLRLASDEHRDLHDHLASCDACAADAAAWGRTSDAIDASRPLAAAAGALESAGPSPEVRDRTLALIRATGVPRARASIAGVPAPAAGSAPPVVLAVPRARPDRRLAWLAAAAAIVVLVGGVAGAQLVGQRDQARSELSDLVRVTTAIDQVLRDPSREVITLAAANQAAPGGTVAWSAASGQLVVISTALPPPASANQEYRCWVERGGSRTVVGRMRFSGSLAYWVGPMTGWGGGPAPGDSFGVSLSSASDGSLGQPVLVGTF